jgi:hypothetical protein
MPERILCLLGFTDNSPRSSELESGESLSIDDPALLMRLYVAAKSLEGIGNPDVASRAASMTESLPITTSAGYIVAST